MLTLEPVSPQNYKETLGLSVAENQQHLIAPVVKSLADAFVWSALPRVARHEDALVGFVLVFPFELNGEPVVNIVRFMIEQGRQRQGLGRELMRVTLDWIRSLEPTPVRVRISTFPENERALKLYRAAGFEGSELEDGEVALWRDA